MPDIPLDEAEHISLCEALDRILNKGAVISGQVSISVANVDLIYLALNVMLTSIETAREVMANDFCRRVPVNLGMKCTSSIDAEHGDRP